MTIKSRMAGLFKKTPGVELDDTPVELGAGKRTQKSISAEIQEQIAIQVALKQKEQGMPLQTVGEIQAELLDLDDESDTEFFSQFEYIDMVDELEPVENFAPTKEGVNNETSNDGPNGQSDSDQEEDRSD